MTTGTLPRADTKPAVPAPARGTPGRLRGLFRRYCGRILLTYGLFTVENALRLTQPLVLGLAINGLLRGSHLGLLAFAAQHLGHLAIGTVRRMYDTRAFSRIYAELATGLVAAQRGRAIDVSIVAARSSLSRSFVDFFERDIPLVMYSVYSVIGALALLAVYDWRLVPLCLVVLVPAWAVNAVYSRKTLLYSGRLHDELEREVGVIAEGGPAGVRGHYDRVGRWRVKLSDWEALNFGVMEVFILGLIAAALLVACQPGATPGDIFAIFRYVLMFVMGLDGVPQVVQQVSRLRDLGRRIGSGNVSTPDGTDTGAK